MRTLLIATLLIYASGCNQASHELTLAFAGFGQHTTKSQSSAKAKTENKPSVGTVARVDLDDNGREKNLNDRLHFCVFENGDSDYIYVGTKYGMWSRGQFDVTIDGKNIFTGEIKHLVYEGVVMQMGDVLSEQPKSNIGVHITRVTGMFK